MIFLYFLILVAYIIVFMFVFYICISIEEAIMEKLTGKGVIEQIYDILFDSKER